MQQTVVFLPGTQCDERAFVPLWQKLDLHDRRYVPLQWAETLEQMDGLTAHAVGVDSVHLVGFSMGGFIASRFALAHPEQVRSLTLMGYCSAGLSDAEQQQRQQYLRVLEKGQGGVMSSKRLAQMVNMQGSHAAEAMQSVQEMEKDLGPSVLKYHLQCTSHRQDLTTPLADSGLQIHLIGGDADQIAPTSQLQKMHKQIPQSRYTSLPDCGHMLALENPQGLAQACSDYWAEVHSPVS
ncbi:alpha/beta hydrolase [Lacimicrobium sp. SS2-24]|uniref:alpha/beta fold hydrolase n=1 Tax=Lacimicrobium sp. SS2-24 TaxID=2005569 RepID=UPI000B4BF700|nr:alpha/beta hydrolase [Lacimicrobium sp. SS2-24]